MGMENFDIEWFKGINELKWPMDPKVFARQFPDRVNDDKSLTGYLDTDDCFVKRDTDASTDLILSRITNISELTAKWNQSRRVVSDLTKEIMQMMRCEGEGWKEFKQGRSILHEWWTHEGNFFV